MQLRYHTPLTAEEQIAHGLAEAQPLAMADRVRYSEIDALQHVNNKAYLTWFETLRVEYFNRLCDPFYDVGMARPRTVLRSANIHFIREMFESEDYIATARVTAFRRNSYTLEQQIWSGDLRARFDCVMVMLDPKGPGKQPLPEALRDVFQTRDSARVEG